MKSVFRLLMTVATAVTLVSVADLVLNAQAGYAGPTAERGRDEGERDLEDRIANRRLLAALDEQRREKSGRRSDPKLALAELQEDFTRLQLINKELVLKTARQTDVDLKLVSKSTSEINRRAHRLMENLVLPEPADGSHAPDPKEPADAKQLKDAITKLGWLIYKFAKNPIFKEADVIEQKSALQARRSLEEIIALSEQMKKSSSRLSKSSTK